MSNDYLLVNRSSRMETKAFEPWGPKWALKCSCGHRSTIWELGAMNSLMAHVRSHWLEDLLRWNLA